MQSVVPPSCNIVACTPSTGSLSLISGNNHYVGTGIFEEVEGLRWIYLGNGSQGVCWAPPEETRPAGSQPVSQNRMTLQLKVVFRSSSCSLKIVVSCLGPECPFSEVKKVTLYLSSSFADVMNASMQIGTNIFPYDNCSRDRQIHQSVVTQHPNEMKVSVIDLGNDKETHREVFIFG